jgi:hypothetical protein
LSSSSAARRRAGFCWQAYTGLSGDGWPGRPTGAGEATRGWSLWIESANDQDQIRAPEELIRLAFAWDVAEGDRADRLAGAEQVHRERDAR